VKFLSMEESEIREMEKVIKNMPVKVLASKDPAFVSIEKDVVRLNVRVQDLRDRSRILGACSNRLYSYIEKRGEGIWNHKWLSSPVGGSMRFRVLAAGKKRCALCGATSSERLLDVDHIVPRSLGGASTFDNLQVLCSKCNRSKGNRSDEDFRRPALKLAQQSVPALAAEPSVQYSGPKGSRKSTPTFAASLETATLVWIDAEKYRAAAVPHRQVECYTDLTAIELAEMNALAKRAINWADSQPSAPAGFTLRFESLELSDGCRLGLHVSSLT